MVITTIEVHLLVHLLIACFTVLEYRVLFMWFSIISQMPTEYTAYRREVLNKYLLDEV